MDADAHMARAAGLVEAGQLEEALPHLDAASRLAPQAPEPHVNRSALLLELSRSGEAVAAAERAAALAPESSVVRLQLALARLAVADREDAEPWFHLGLAQADHKHPAESAQSLERCLALDPQHGPARYQLGKARFQIGRVEAAMTALRTAASTPGDDATALRVRALARQTLAVLAPGSPADDDASVLALRRAYAADCEPALPAPARPSAARRSEGPLRVGYVSSYFHGGNWMKPVWALLNRHDRERFALHLFCDGDVAALDAGYARDARDQVHEIGGLSNEAAAALVREQQLDVLVDLNGYSVPGRLPLYAARPAAVVVGWFNLYATTGLACFDVLVGDATVAPPADDFCGPERVERPADTYLCFEVAYPVPDVAPPPSLAAGHLTFGSLASQYKLNDATLDAWSEILRGAPTARLLLRNAALGVESTREDLRARFAERSVDAERLRLAGPAEHYAFLETYAAIDVALDPFPYNGGTTTTEALWQGVPVLAFRGDRWASRTSASLLVAAGQSALVADDRDAHVARAIAWANDPSTPRRLAETRASLRDRLRASPACDVDGFARAMEALYVRVAHGTPVAGVSEA